MVIEVKYTTKPKRKTDAAPDAPSVTKSPAQASETFRTSASSTHRVAQPGTDVNKKDFALADIRFGRALGFQQTDVEQPRRDEATKAEFAGRDGGKCKGDSGQAGMTYVGCDDGG
ncbi:MAG: hypothetical protein HQK89_18230 [Nitrospirae bacterium]|nr:hypothetical protein [Nitrospirota bacterium]